MTRPLHPGEETLTTGKDILQGPLSALRSTRLTLVLLPILAVMAGVGSFLPAGETGPALYRSLPFRALLGLLCLNMGACLWSRRGRAGGLGPALSLAGHLALLLTMGFALAGSLFGTMATQNVRVGDTARTVFDWGTGRDRTLPFEVRVLELSRELYPYAVQVGVRVRATGEKRELISTFVGGDFTLSGVPGRFTLRYFNPAFPDWEFSWIRPAWGETFLRQGEDIPGSGLELVVVRYRSYPEEKALEAKVEAVRGGEIIARGAVSPNRPFLLEGHGFYLTATGKDEEGMDFVGFQVTTDPFRPWVLGFGTLFLLAVSGSLLLKAGGRGSRREGGSR